jgi:hypothetical protein
MGPISRDEIFGWGFLSLTVVSWQIFFVAMVTPRTSTEQPSCASEMPDLYLAAIGEVD